MLSGFLSRDQPQPAPATSSITVREREVLTRIAHGHSNKVIARKCGIAEATVKAHVKSILLKIQATNRTQAAVWAVGQGYGDSQPHGQ